MYDHKFQIEPHGLERFRTLRGEAIAQTLAACERGDRKSVV